jgi:hypothetical protein
MHLQGKEKQELDLLLASDDKLLSDGASKDTQNCIHGVLGFLDTDDPATKKKIIDIAYKVRDLFFSMSFACFWQQRLLSTAFRSTKTNCVQLV